jgi:hypothetical protein
MLSKTSLRKSLATLAPGWDLAPILVDFGRYLECSFGSVFEWIFGVHFGQFSIADLLVLRDFFDFEVPFGPLFGRLFDRPFGRHFHHFWTRLVSLPQFSTAVDTLPIRTLNCTPASI